MWKLILWSFPLCGLWNSSLKCIWTVQRTCSFQVITEHVYKLLEEHGLHRIYIPKDVPQEQASFIYSTQKDLKSPKKLLVLIHGSGVVRVGQWARKLIINDPGLKAGTVLPYIDEARKLGYEVLITNTNLNRYTTNDGRSGTIKGSESPTKHALTVWDEIIKPAQPEAIGIVAHSFGGVVAVDIANARYDYFKNRVFAVGMTDSVHFGGKIPEELRARGRNWVTSRKPLDELIKAKGDDVPRHSAGRAIIKIIRWLGKS